MNYTTNNLLKRVSEVIQSLITLRLLKETNVATSIKYDKNFTITTTLTMSQDAVRLARNLFEELREKEKLSLYIESFDTKNASSSYITIVLFEK